MRSQTLRAYKFKRPREDHRLHQRRLLATCYEKHFATFIDERAKEQEYVLVSAGVRGKQIKIAPNDLLKACEASYADIARLAL